MQRRRCHYHWGAERALLGLLLGALLLAWMGCGNGGSKNAPGPGSSITGAAQPSQSAFLYGSPGQGLFAARIDAASGQVSTVADGILDTPLGGFILFYGVDPKGRFLYTSERAGSSFGIPLGGTGIGEFTIERSSGALFPVTNGTVTLAAANKIVVDPDGRFLHTVQSGGIDAYSINPSSGQLTRLAGAPFGSAVGDFVDISPDGRFLFNVGGGRAQTFSLDSSGRPTARGAEVATGSADERDIAVSPDGRFLFVLNGTGNNVSILQIAADGTLTPILPLQLNFRPISVAFTPSGQFVYISTTNDRGGTAGLFAFRIDSVGNLTPVPGSPILTNTMVFQIAADLSGRFLYVGTPDGGGLLTFRIDSTNGALTQSSKASGDVNNSQTITTSP